MFSQFPFFRSGLPTEPAWKPERDMPSQEGRIAIVTGGATGIGLETTRQLLQHGAHVYVFGRSAEKDQAALRRLHSELEEAGPSAGVSSLGEARFIPCDLSSLKSIQQSAQQFLDKEKRLDIMIANAGVFAASVPGSADGYEGMFATNCLGHHALIQHLVPALRTAAGDPSTKPHSTRVVFISSNMHDGPKKEDFDDFGDSPSNAGTFKSMGLYGRSKLGNIFTASRLSDDFAKEGTDVVVTAVHPGPTRSELSRQNSALMMAIIAKMIMWPTSFGTFTPLWAATAPEAAGISGSYVVPWGQVGSTGALAKDMALRDKVWDWCQKQMETANSK